MQELKRETYFWGTLGKFEEFLKFVLWIHSIHKGCWGVLIVQIEFELTAALKISNILQLYIKIAHS